MTLPSYVLRWLQRFDTVPKLESVYYSCIVLEVSLSIEAIVTTEITVKNHAICKDGVAGDSMQQDSHSEQQPKGKLILYRRRFHILHAYVCKNAVLRDIIIIELPMLQGWRTGEISTLRAEDVNSPDNTIEVLDSKKHRYYTQPMNYQLAMHLSKYIQQMEFKGKDLLIQPLPDAPRKFRKPNSKTVGIGLSLTQIDWTWTKYSRLSGLPKPLTPREGRAYFAANWHFILKKSDYHLRVMMRHDYQESLDFYLSRIVDWDDLVTEFHQGEDSPFSLTCQHKSSCLGAQSGCHCKMFLPSTTKITEVKS